VSQDGSVSHMASYGQRKTWVLFPAVSDIFLFTVNHFRPTESMGLKVDTRSGRSKRL